MSAGFKYNLEPEIEQEERYDVESGRRRRGPYVLDTENLVKGSYLPSFTPIAADLVKKTAKVAIRVEVAEKFTSGTELRVKKGSLAYKGMHLGDGAHGATVNEIDKSNVNYDKITLSKDLGAAQEAGKVLYEATDVNGTSPKVVANSALYERKQVEDGIVVVALLMQAYEIEPTKLVMPFADVDKANMPHFQFNAAGAQGVTNTYVLPEASSTQMGGIQLGFTQTAKKYAVQLDGGKAYVEVPWTDNNTTYNAANSTTLGLVKQAAKVNDASGTVTPENFNGLLTALKNAGIMVK